MTPLETLQKYNLKTDTKSIRERIFKLLLLHDIDESVVWYDVELTGIQAMEVCDLISLLCELAEKGEREQRWESAIKNYRKKLVASRESHEIDCHFDALWIIDYELQHINDTIAEAEGEWK